MVAYEVSEEIEMPPVNEPAVVGTNLTAKLQLAEAGSEAPQVLFTISKPASAVATLKPVLKGYLNENKRYATIAIGCTGGKHRSVALVRALSAQLGELDDVTVSVKHRDLGRE